MIRLHDAKCHCCKHHNAMLATLRREPFMGYVPCTSCIHFQDSRTDKFERVPRDQIDKSFLDAKAYL